MLNTVDAAPSRNGSVGAPMPIKSVTVDCDAAGYPGWHARLRTNIPARVFDDFASMDEERFWRSLATIVIDWNFADEDGQPLPTPSDGLEWRDLPFDLAAHLVRSYSESFAALTQVPKASDANSEPTFTTSGGQKSNE